MFSEDIAALHKCSFKKHKMSVHGELWFLDFHSMTAEVTLNGKRGWMDERWSDGTDLVFTRLPVDDTSFLAISIFFSFFLSL